MGKGGSNVFQAPVKDSDYLPARCVERLCMKRMTTVLRPWLPLSVSRCETESQHKSLLIAKCELAGLVAWNTQGDGAEAVAIVLFAKVGLVCLPPTSSLRSQLPGDKA